MNYKIKIIIVSVLLSITSNVFAAKFGIGMSARSGETEIYFPIDISSRWRVEPSIRYSQYEDSQSASTTSFDTSYYSKQKTLDLSLGFFYQYQAYESVAIYYGLRGGYSIIEYETRSVTDQTSSSSTYKGDGYSVVPTLGIEYWFAQRFTVAGEVGYAFSKSGYDNTSSSSSSIDSFNYDTEGHSTMSRLILRYFF